MRNFSVSNLKGINSSAGTVERVLKTNKQKTTHKHFKSIKF